ncbi:hypothetical protein Agub_g5789, partial [Astrephomene gubernaculifera]
MQMKSSVRLAAAQPRLNKRQCIQPYQSSPKPVISSHAVNRDAHVPDLHHDRIPASAPASSRRGVLGLLSGTTLALVTAGTTDLLTPAPALAALKDYNLDPSAPIEEVSMQLGTEDGQYVFTPSTLEFTMGRIYKLKLTNPSSITHYFTPLEFAEKVFTIQVLAGDPAVEVKGAVAEVALKAGAAATWVFIPMKPGRYPLRCTVKGHDDMLGQ